MSRIIISTDKTTVRGDVLIDDKPIITGSMQPTWRQLMFDAPYNRAQQPAARICRWADWEASLELVLQKGSDDVATVTVDAGRSMAAREKLRKPGSE